MHADLMSACEANRRRELRAVLARKPLPADLAPPSWSELGTRGAILERSLERGESDVSERCGDERM